MYFEPEVIIKEDFLLNFCVSERGAGKTFSTLKRCVEDYLRDGSEFIYMRRTDAELELAEPKMFSALKAEGYFSDNVLSCKKGVLLCDGKSMGGTVAINTAYKLKSVAFPKVKTIVFDEFISEDKRYLKNEVTKFLSAIETIARMRDIKIICLANQNTLYNPYYTYFKIKPHSDETPLTKFKTKSILIYQFNSVEYREAKKETKFGKLIADTPYGDFMLDNKNILDDDSMVDKITTNKDPMVNMLINNSNIVVYNVHTKEEKFIYFKMRKAVSGVRTYNFDKMLKENTRIENINSNPLCKRIKVYLNRGDVRFNSVLCKQTIESFIF